MTTDPTSELWTRPAWALADAVRNGALRATDVLDAHLARIDALEPLLNAFAHQDRERARADAESIDARVAAGEDPGPLAGVPMGIKELTQAEGWPDTHGSRALADHVATFDSMEVARLRAAGAVLVGLTTAPEHGAVSFTRSSLHGVTRNPWDPTRTPGGSSGGSAAAVAAGMLPAASGSDGGGSTRIPASYTGLPGIKPTLGRIPFGPAPFSDSLTATPGPLVRTVRDAARYLDVTAGPSLTDPTSLPKPAPYEARVLSGELAEGLRGLRVGWTSTLGYAATDPDVEALTRDAAEQLVRASGLTWVDIDPQIPRLGSAWGMLSSLSDAAWYLEPSRERWDELDPPMRAAFEMIDHVGSGPIMKAIRRRHELLSALAPVFAAVDLLLTPTTATTAFAAEGTYSGMVAGREVNLMLLSAAFTAPFNMTMQPAMSIPAGLVDGLPVGLQAVARRHEDELCLAAGAVLEEVRPWPGLAPEPA